MKNFAKKGICILVPLMYAQTLLSLNLPTRNGETVTNVIANTPFYKHELKSYFENDNLVVHSQIIRCQIERDRIFDKTVFAENNGVAFGQTMEFAKNLFEDPLVLSASEKSQKLDNSCTKFESSYTLNGDRWNKDLKLTKGIDGGWYTTDFNSTIEYNTCVADKAERYGQALSMLKLRYFKGKKNLLKELPTRVFEQDYSYGWAATIREIDLGKIEFTEIERGSCFDVKLQTLGYVQNQKNIDTFTTKNMRINPVKNGDLYTLNKVYLDSSYIGNIEANLKIRATRHERIKDNDCILLQISDHNGKIQQINLNARQKV